MKYIFPILVVISLILTSCDPKNSNTTVGDVKITELEDKKNYNFPLSLINDVSGDIYINGELVNFNNNVYQLPHAGFFQLDIKQGESLTRIRFNLIDTERGESEWGLKKWVPAIPEISTLTGENIEVIYPKNITPTINVPIVFYINEANEHKLINLDGLVTSTNSSFLIKNGVGSVLVSAEIFENSRFVIGEREITTNTNNLSKVDLELAGVLSTAITINENQLVYISNDLEITQTGSLTINSGAVVVIAPGVNITNYGPIHILGESNNPVYITCTQKTDYWGGFISEGSTGSIDAQHCFFTQSGFHEGGDFNLGHAKRQALFQTTNSSLTLSDCYITDNIGQIFYPTLATLELNNVLVQRAKTGGQLNSSEAEINSCIFTDFPNDNQEFIDEDNDGLYINESNVTINNSIFMYAKDDGLDSGASAGGAISVENSTFEACFHEGAALSSSDPVLKSHSFKNCKFLNNGQGLELGYSSSNHLVLVDSCYFTNNHVGVRYGDNYPWDMQGTMKISNCISIYNDRDVWNMVRETWEPKLLNMEFSNTFISKKTEQYPSLEIYN